MKFGHILLLCGAAALPQLATADLAETNPAGLGEVRALLDFCARIDPPNSASFKAEWQSIVGSESGLLAQFQANPKYQHAYDAFMSELGQLPGKETVKICTAGAAAWNNAKPAGDGGRTEDDPGHKGAGEPGHKPDRETDR